MYQKSTTFLIDTQGAQMRDVTGEIAAWIVDAGAREGVVTLLCRHTSAGLLIQENSDPDVRTDLETAMRRLAPRDASLWRHGPDEPDDMPAHVRTALTGATLSIPVADGWMRLGGRQGDYLWEHRDNGGAREIAAHLLFD